MLAFLCVSGGKKAEDGTVEIMDTQPAADAKTGHPAADEVREYKILFTAGELK